MEEEVIRAPPAPPAYAQQDRLIASPKGVPMVTKLDKNVKLAADALVRGDDANWELAQLTHENTYTGRRRVAEDDSRLSMDEWCRRIREQSGRKFVRSTGLMYKAVWERFGDHDSDHQMAWSEAYWEVRGDKPGSSFAATNAKQAIKHLDAVPVEEKRALARALMADPETEEQLEREFIQRAGRDPSLVAKIDRVYEEHHPQAKRKERKAGAFELIVGLGVGTELLSHARKQRQDVDDLAAALGAYHGELPEDVLKAVASVREKLTQTTAIITGYDDQIAAAMGVDYDAVFRRLTGSA
jgi:hypothetical protein